MDQGLNIYIFLFSAVGGDRNEPEQGIFYQLAKSYYTFNKQTGSSTRMYPVSMNVVIYPLKAAKRRVLIVQTGDDPLNFGYYNDANERKGEKDQ